jgi:N-acetylmuramoyl-L-alanine amidase
MEIYKKGSRGEMVRQIQKALNLLVDGIYGEVTTEAVRAFQTENGLKADGIVGPATLTKLIPVRWKRSKPRITEIIVHRSATPEGKDYTVLDIRKWHKQQGWSDIGYHYVVYRNGHIEAGRDVDIIGAHCEGHNAHSIGVCYIGGCARDGRTPKDTRTLAQKAALISVLTELRQMYPQAKIYGHRDFDKHGKKCPSFDAKEEYKKI